MYGEPSSSMVILYEGKPILLVDMGLGIIKAYQATLGKSSSWTIIYTKDTY